MSGGYARDAVDALPQDNAYLTLIEPLESFAALSFTPKGSLDSELRYAYTADGRRYISALGR